MGTACGGAALHAVTGPKGLGEFDECSGILKHDCAISRTEIDAHQFILHSFTQCHTSATQMSYTYTYACIYTYTHVYRINMHI